MFKETLKDAIRINSVFPKEQEISIFWEKLLRKSGFVIQRQKIDSDRENIFATKGNGERSVLFYGHMDTVAAVNSEEWIYDPFTPQEKDGKLYGLGSSDMKSGILAFIEASSNSNSYIKILLGVDEENVSEGAWKAVEERKDFFQDVDLIVSAEPNFGLGINSITTGRTGRVIFDVTFKGKSEHIIKYKQGIDSFKLLSNYGTRFYEQRDSIFNSPKTVAQVRRVWGESVGMSVCSEAGLEVEVVLDPEDNINNILTKLQELGGEIRLKPRKTPYLTGYTFSDFPYKEVIKKIIKRNTDRDMTENFRSSVADDNVLATLGIPVITWGPEGKNEHAPDEYVDLQTLETLIVMYQEFLKEIQN